MSRNLLKRVQVVSGKTAGILARETLAIAKRAGSVPSAIKVKTAGVIEVTGKALRVKKSRSDIKKWEKKKWATFTKLGELIFELGERKTKNVEQRKDTKSLVSELRKFDAEIRWIRAQITEIEENCKEKIGYQEAVVGLSSKEKDIRLAAVKSLEQLGGKGVIPILAKRLEDPDSRVRQETVRVLQKIIDREYQYQEAGGSESG